MPQLEGLLRVEPDLVDRIFDYLVQQLPEIRTRVPEVKQALREEFAGERAYVRVRAKPGSPVVNEVLRLFNGRNATEVARTLRIGRATVYRALKQAGRRTPE